ncbi:MAG: 8-oxo-dGTP diphosphatase [Candidatus Woesearchaeota archaeon]
MRPVTLIYCIKGDEVLLGMKKRGFGKGKLNGYGGKVALNENIDEAAIRELAEEAKITAQKKDLEKVAEINFYFSDVPKEKDYDQKVHVFFLKKWSGEPTETEEMKPYWYKISDIPLEKMWVDDKYWLHKVFEGQKIRASFTFKDQGAAIKKYSLEAVKQF